MADVHAILLVPVEGDPLGLLREGPCGARPPMAWTLRCERCGDLWAPRVPGSKSMFQAHRHHWNRTGLSARIACRWQNPVALVLAWNGEVVHMGCHVLGWATREDVHAIWASTEAAMRGVKPARLGRHGTLILLDAEGREVSRV